MSARRVAFINEKGGTCKTTLAVNVAAYLAEKKKKRVLLVDLDTQGHAGKSLGVDPRGLSKNVFHLLTDAAVTLEQVTLPTATANLSLVPSWKEMAEFPTLAASDPERARLLARRLRPALDHYDFVLFDAPPSLGLTTTNILLAAEEVVVPVATTYLALDGCAEMVATVDDVKATYGHQALRITLVVPTLYRKTQLADEVLAKLRQYFPRRTAEPFALSVTVDEAQSHGKTIWEYAPWSRGATMLQSIAEAVDKAGR
ncbi:MAG: ParA family protein [Myxococcus sp.]|nr:ParA family protein [Myxococcus sp.]